MGRPRVQDVVRVGEHAGRSQSPAWFNSNVHLCDMWPLNYPIEPDRETDHTGRESGDVLGKRLGVVR